MKISAIAVLILSFNLKSAVYEIRDYTIEEEFLKHTYIGPRITSCRMEWKESK